MSGSRRLSACDMHDLLEFGVQCAHATQATEIIRLLDALNKWIPFDAAIISLVELQKDKIGSVTGVNNHSFDQQWLKEYEQSGFLRIDPVVRHAQRTTGPFEWHEAYHAPGTHDKVFLEAARSYSLNNGIACVTRMTGIGKHASLLSLSMGSGKVTAYQRTMIRYLAPHLHLACARAVDVPFAAHALSVRELEILKWVMGGKSNWEVGVILAVSERAVKYDLGSIFRKLQVGTRAQAVARALQLNIM